MKNLRGCTFLFVFFLILGSCGSGVSVYEPGQVPGLDNPEADGGSDDGGSDDATIALLSAIFDDDDEELIVDDAKACPEGTEAVAAETRSMANVVDISTGVRALNVIPSHAKYAVYEARVVNKLKRLFLSNLEDDAGMAEILKILISRLSEKDYELLLKLTEKASLIAFNSTATLEKKVVYSCTCSEKYREKEEKGDGIFYCDPGEVLKFKLALDDETVELVDRCKSAIAALTAINEFDDGCIEYTGLKQHYYNTCENKCQNEYVPIFNKYIGAVQKPGDPYCEEAAKIASKAKESGVCMDWILQNMVNSYEVKCGASALGICLDYSKKFEEVYNEVACKDLSALQKVIDEAATAGCYVSKMKEIYKKCDVPDVCEVLQKQFDGIYEKSACSDTGSLENTMTEALKMGCVYASKMKEIFAGCKEVPDVCAVYQKQFDEIYAKSACGNMVDLMMTIDAAAKETCDTADMKKVYETCK